MGEGDERVAVIAVDDADVVLADPSVSGRHARLAVTAEGARVEDLGSKNGTRVGGERVEARLLAHGDELRLGNAVLRTAV